MLPNNEIVEAFHQGLLPLSPTLSKESKTVLVYPNITNESLLSIAQPCDDKCTAISTEKLLHVYKNKELLFEGYRNRVD